MSQGFPSPAPHNCTPWHVFRVEEHQLTSESRCSLFVVSQCADYIFVKLGEGNPGRSVLGTQVGTSGLVSLEVRLGWITQDLDLH